MSLWLSPQELVELTGYTYQKRQKLALAKMDIPFRSRASDGYPLVARDLFATSHKFTARRKESKPRLEILREM